MHERSSGNETNKENDIEEVKMKHHLANTSSTVVGQVVLDPIVERFVDELEREGGPHLWETTIEQARANHAKMQATSLPLAPADVTDLTIESGDHRPLLLRIVRPQGVPGQLPAVMYLHGGGWVLGDRHDWDRLLRDTAQAAQAAVVFVEFSRAPESRYPVAIEEAYSALSWIGVHGREVNLDPTRLAVAGDSAGGNMAAAVAIMAKQRRGPRLDFQVLLYPSTDSSFSTASYEQFENGPFLSKRDVEWFLDQYAPDATNRNEITAAPLKATPDDLRGLPPALVITAEADVLRDEGEAYARKVMQAGVPVTATRYLGTIHAFVTINRLAETAAAKAAIQQVGAALRSVFDRKPAALRHR